MITACSRLDNNPVRTFLQIWNNLCVFTCVRCKFFVTCVDNAPFRCTGGSNLVCCASFPWGGAWGSLAAHSPLQSATLLSQHYHYLRWPNLHVERSITFYIIFAYKVYVGFLSCLRDWTVVVVYSKFAC
jgi:hypothetical protein